MEREILASRSESSDQPRIGGKTEAQLRNLKEYEEQQKIEKQLFAMRDKSESSANKS